MNIKEDIIVVQRLEEISLGLLKYEMFYLIDILGLKHHLPLSYSLKIGKSSGFNTQAKVLKNLFEHLGGAFLKLGQMISMRPDLFGKDFSMEFNDFLDKVPPEDFAAIKGIINQSIPKGLGAFDRFDEIPIAAGSIAQVHKAVLDGKDVVVKVKRKGVDEKFRSDILIMDDFARRIKRHLGVDFIDPVDVVEEFKKYTNKELDFNHEKSSISRFKKNFANNKNVHIPFVYDAYSGRDVIVMELMHGHTILELPMLSQKDKSLIVRNVFSATFKQLFEDGFFHADLHAGNILISKDRSIGLLDFGITGYIDDSLKRKLTELFIALIDGDLNKTTECLLDLNIGKNYPDKNILNEGIYYALADYYGTSIGNMNFSQIFYNAIDTAKKANVKMPAQLVLFGKSIISMEGFCRMIDPNYNFIEESRPYAKRLLLRQLAPSKIAQGSISAAISFKNMMLNIPEYVKEFSNQMQLIERSAVELDMQFSQFQKTLVRMTKAMIFGIILASLIISSALLIDSEPKIFNISVISLIGYVISILLSINIIWLFKNK